MNHHITRVKSGFQSHITDKELYDDTENQSFVLLLPKFVPVPLPGTPNKGRIIGTISFYNEKKGIERILTSIYQFCDTIVCIDGAYASFPHKRPWSTDGTIKRIKNFPDPDQKIILIHTTTPWKTEVEKRNTFFSFGIPGDWYFIVDGDEELVYNTYGLDKVKYIIKKTTHDHPHIIQIGVETVPDPNQVGGFSNKLQRHIDGVVYARNHFTFYSFLEGFWFGQYFRHQARRFANKLQRGLPFKVIHHKRDQKRQKQKEEYYNLLPSEERYDWWNWIGRPTGDK